MKATPPLIEIEGLSVKAHLNSGDLTLVENLNLELKKGEVVGLIGESGSGKTTVARSLVGIHEPNVSITAGRICFGGMDFFNKANGVDRVFALRGKHVGMVFQSPRAALNPLMTVHAHLDELIQQFDGSATANERQDTIAEILSDLRLDSQRVLFSYPHQLSGGMCQRVAIALALVAKPDVLVADECTSSLDVTTQWDVVTLLQELQRKYELSVLFITHNILLASEICSNLIIMNSGKVVEIGETKSILMNPKNEYTRRLISAVPRWHQ